ncbi:hypothetical protein ACGFJC_47650 [Nonomuraea fuscirosea]|uniref:hypothetical protein n=1 Tax=Nonomuraea fuscirosea TaxID=1291556 RepID=UPI003723FC9D
MSDFVQHDNGGFCPDWLTTASIMAEQLAEREQAVLQQMSSHEVMRRVVERRNTARTLWLTDVGDAVEQTITMEEAQALRDHYEQLRSGLDGQHLPPPDPIVPGKHWATVYGVQLTVEDRAPLLGEYTARPGPGRLKSVREIAESLMPAGTRLAGRCRMLVPANVGPDAVQDARKWIANEVNAPHYLAILTADDLPGHEHPPHLSDKPGWRVVYGFVPAAIPGQTPYIVFRPAPSLPAQWAHPSSFGEWQERGHIRKQAHLMAVHGMEDRLEGRMLTARATGRVEILDGQAAEIFEVTL